MTPTRISNKTIRRINPRLIIRLPSKYAPLRSNHAATEHGQYSRALHCRSSQLDSRCGTRIIVVLRVNLFRALAHTRCAMTDTDTALTGSGKPWQNAPDELQPHMPSRMPQHDTSAGTRRRRSPSQLVAGLEAASCGCYRAVIDAVFPARPGTARYLRSLWVGSGGSLPTLSCDGHGRGHRLPVARFPSASAKCEAFGMTCSYQ
jgi:hypothetical protein